MTENIRLTFEIPPQLDDRVNKLATEIGGDRSQVWKFALDWISYYAHEAKNGRSLGSFDLEKNVLRIVTLSSNKQEVQDSE